jgi:hypothetical protein
MKITIVGKGKVNLSKNDYVSSGGEGDIYKQGKTIFKIYKNQKSMIPEGKISELSILKHNSIVIPEDIIVDSSGNAIGFTSKWVEGTPICKLFVTGYRNRNGITDQNSIDLVNNVKDVISFVHKNNCLIVDGNENNYLIDNDNVTPYCIDVNSWQTKSFAASAIMSSIRDWLSSTFTTLTDWYSFAVISCQLFTGIHPYKGNHPKYKISDVQELIKKRLLDHVSIFNKDVALPPNVRMSSIPQTYKDWFMRIFEKGERCVPPGEIGVVVIVPKVIKIKGTNNFDIVELPKYSGKKISWHTKIEGIETTKVEDEFIIDNRRYPAKKDQGIIFSESFLHPIIVEIENLKLKFREVNIKINNCVDVDAEKVMIVGNSLYYKNYDNLIEMRFHDKTSSIIPATKHIWKIMPNASTLYAGVIYQQIFGNAYLAIPLPERGDKLSRFIIKPIPELNSYKVIDAKHEKGVCAVYVVDKKGNYKIMVFKFDSIYDKYTMFEIPCQDIGDINISVLDNGICVMIPYSGLVKAFHNGFNHNDVKDIYDPEIDSDMRLCHSGTQLRFFKEDRLFSISIRK